MCTLLFVLNRLSRVLARFINRAGVTTPIGADLRSLGPIHTCICGSMLFKVGCMFDDGEISLWFVDAECALCGALVKVPTPLDD